VIFGLGRKPRSPGRLSVTVATQDQASALRGLLRNVEGFASEVVVVDGGSRDDTEAVARAHPLVRYVHRPWDGHFGRQKNCSLAHATGDWILHLDTDERVGERLRDRLPELMAGRHDFYRLPMYWLASEAEPLLYVKTDKHYPSPVPRLFRNLPEFRYVEDGHPVHVTFTKAVRRRMKKVQGAHLFHYVLAWLTREELRAKAARYASVEPGSEGTNAAYYLYWERPHELLPCAERPVGGNSVLRTG
jgi:glycosyltransferase involved in cell wall biosynthesis